MFGAIHEYVVCHQLAVVFVGSHHIGGDALTSGFSGESSDHVVGFVSCHFQNRDAVGVDDILYNRYGEADGFRSFFTLGFVLFESFVAEGRSGGVEGYSYM